MLSLQKSLGLTWPGRISPTEMARATVVHKPADLSSALNRAVPHSFSVLISFSKVKLLLCGAEVIPVKLRCYSSYTHGGRTSQCKGDWGIESEKHTAI